MAAVKGGGKADIALPKFEVGSTFELTDVLGALGVKREFTDDAQFAGISKLPTKISGVIHKAWVKVDEKGTEAAAATAVVMVEITDEQTPIPSRSTARSCSSSTTTRATCCSAVGS